MNLTYGISCLFLVLLCLNRLVAQETPVFDDFEGNGTINSWTPDNCGMDISFPNPYQDAINPSETVLRYHDTGGRYANVRFEVPYNFDLSENHRFTLKIYVPSGGLTGNQPYQLSLKLQDGGIPEPWRTQTEVIKPISADQWQLVYFDFEDDPFINLDPDSPHPVERTDFNRVVLRVNGENNNDHVLAFIDDVHYDGTVGNDPDPNDPVFDAVVWSDEFDNNGPVDPHKWHHQTLLPNGNSWYNNELQHYTDRIENSYVEDGMLYIRARKESFTDQGVTKQYTSARLNSKFAFTYGKVEIRAMLPKGGGTWPAIWMLGKNIAEPGGYWYDQFGTVGWPSCGEIDIMEHWGNNQNHVSSALHTPCSFGGTVNVGGRYVEDVSDTFHLYTLEWFPDRMEFSLDGNIYYIYNPPELNDCHWPFYEDQYLLLNVAMITDVDPAFTESPMVIDYVRVYQEELTSTRAARVKSGNFLLLPNPSSTRFSVVLSRMEQKGVVTITDISGKEVFRKSFRDKTRIDLDPGLPEGLFFVTVRTPSAVISRKLLVN